MTEKCKSCFETDEVVPVQIREERGQPWVECSLKRCANDECWSMREGTIEDRLKWVNNVYDYKYFGDYELSPEQLSAVYEAKAIATSLHAVERAAKRLAYIVRKSVNSGPLSKDPTQEAEAWRALRTALGEGYDERGNLVPLPSPPSHT